MQGSNSHESVLSADVISVRQVSAGRAAKLAKLGVHTVYDLLCLYPHRYIDLSNIQNCADAPLGEMATVVGRLEAVKQKQPRPRMHVIEAALVDDTGAIQAVWFRQPWMINKLHPGARVALTGKVIFDYGMRKMNSPQVVELGEDGQTLELGMAPVHPATDGLSVGWMRILVANALEVAELEPDPLPATLRARRGLMGRRAAWRCIHFPKNKTQQQRARTSLAYREVLGLQLTMMMRRNAETAAGTPFAHTAGSACERLRELLPFTLTSDQENAVAEIIADMQRPAYMNRMLLGDVGCGKTIVAAFALACAADSGGQAALMAPTEVLARQHVEKLAPLLEEAGISCAALTGSTSAPERAEILERLASGELKVLIGTHALIEPQVRFNKLTLSVIDEQHRFGVDQRSALRAKGEGVDLLLMTATPIPRTLALTLYGDLETSVIRQRPANRPPVETKVISRHARWHAYDAVREAVKQGRQAYIVCPLVGLSREQRQEHAEDGSLSAALSGGADITDPKAAELEAKTLQRDVFPNLKVGLLTGRMPSAQKQEVMASFAAGDIDVLVATTVIEVGIDVPNATVMIIEDAERFGLSQLHQLRGRVGRGSHAGQVFLIADPGKDDEELQARMEAIATTTDGFALAQADLKARREGDVLGVRQHGQGALRLVNVVEDAELVSQAHADARSLLEGDPLLSAPEHALLKRDLAIMFPEDNA